MRGALLLIVASNFQELRNVRNLLKVLTPLFPVLQLTFLGLLKEF